MKNRNVSVLVACAVAALWSGVGHAAERSAVTFGAIVTLKHAGTGRYLTATDEQYVHPGSSGQPAVYAADDGKDKAAQWIVKGAHNGDRWAFNIHDAGDISLSSEIGWPLRRGQIIRLENVQTARNLHSHHCPAPRAAQHGQSEVTNLGNDGVADTNDNFTIETNDAASGNDYISSGFKLKLKHNNTGNALHSHGLWWEAKKQEVTTMNGRDDNDWWIIEIVAQPDKNPAIASIRDNHRSVKLSYWTPLFWDSETQGIAKKSCPRRIWAHGGSRHDGGNNLPPHDHMELLAGPWGDYRARQGAALFLIHNADDKFKTGNINFGDRIKILATHGGAGEQDKAGLLLPFRYLWLHNNPTGPSRWGAPYREIIASRPEHSNTQDDGAIFVLKPVVAGQTGPISTDDLVIIQNVLTGASIWTHPDSRFGGWFYELLGTKDREDAWGQANVGWYRDSHLNKFRFSLANDQSTDESETRSAISAVNKEVSDILGAEAAKQKAIADAAKIAQLEKDKAAAAAKAKADAAERARLVADDAKKLEDLKKAQEAQLAEAAKKGADALAAAQKAADEAMAKMKDDLAKEKDQAAKALQEAKDAAEKAKRDIEEHAKQVVSEAEAKAKAEVEKANAHAAELQHMLDLPTGFKKIDGKAAHIAFGLQDREIERAVDNKGKKEKMVAFEDFGLAVLDDGSVAQYVPAGPNHWQHVALVDEKGTEIKASGACVGVDGTSFVISQDGKSLYGINWPGDTPAAMPQEKAGFAVAHKKATDRKGAHSPHAAHKKHAAGKHHRKNKKGARKSAKKANKSASVASATK